MSATPCTLTIAFRSITSLPFQHLTTLATACIITIASSWTVGWAQEPNTPSTQEVRLFSGWNNISYQGITLPLPDALNDARSHVKTIWQHVAETQEWKVWQEGLPPSIISLKQLQAGGIYFVQATESVVWTQPLTPPVTPPNLPEPIAPTMEWDLVFTRTANAFGLTQTLHFNATGIGSISESNNAEQEATVGTESLAVTDKLLRENNFFNSWPATPVTGCGSCFLYEITIQNPNGEKVTVHVDDFGLTGALFLLVEQLSAILISKLS